MYKLNKIIKQQKVKNIEPHKIRVGNAKNHN